MKPLLYNAPVAAGPGASRSEFVATEATSGDASFDELDAYVRRQMARLRIPGASLAVVEGDRIVHLRGFGRAHPDGEAPTPQTPFFIGSLTKSFTALAVMQLVEAGKIELDAPVQRYLPWFRVADAGASAQMTVRHLLNQTGGLPTWVGEVILADSDDSPDAAERQARALSSLALARPVGSAYEYSNSNYQLLGLIVEAAGGERYADYVQNHILAPLGMNHSYASPGQAQRGGPATGHRYWFGRPVVASGIPLPHGALAAGLLASTAEDMALYLIAHLNGGRCGEAQVLSAAGVEEMHRGAVDCGLAGLGPIERFVARNIEMGQYGMGWNVDKIGRTTVVWHGGTLPDFGGYMALLPERKMGVVLLYNANHHFYMPVFAEFGTGAAALLAGEQPAPLAFTGVVPRMMPALLLLPALQIAAIAAALLPAGGRGAADRPQASAGREWGPLSVVQLILNALFAVSALKILSGRRRGYLKLYMPDVSLIAAVCGVLSLVWGFLRAGRIIGTLRKAPS